MVCRNTFFCQQLHTDHTIPQMAPGDTTVGLTPVAYLAEHAKLLGIIKRPRTKSKPREHLDSLEDILTWD
jgi:hypothetical protein